MVLTPCALTSELLTQRACQWHAEAKATLLSNSLFPIFNYIYLSFRQIIKPINNPINFPLNFNSILTSISIFNLQNLINQTDNFTL